MNKKSLELDKSSAIIGFFISVFLIVYLINTHNVIYLVSSFLLLISCLMWILFSKNASIRLNIPESYPITLLLSSLYFFLFTFSILSVFFRVNHYERPLIYFVLTSLMVGIVALEIIFLPSKKLTGLILAQIVIIGLSLLWTQELIFPSVIGIDPLWHRMFTLKILDMGQVPQAYIYSGIPFFHLIIASTSLLTGLNYELSVMLSVNLIYIAVTIFFVFLIGTFMYNEKVGLFSGLLLCTANMWIQFGWWAVPNSIAMVFVPIIIYLIFKLKTKRPIDTSYLIILLMFSVILTHTVTSVWLGFILVQIWISSIVYNKTQTKSNTLSSLTLISLFFILMFSWWIYVSGYIIVFMDLIKWGFNIDQFTHVSRITEYMRQVPVAEKIFDNIGQFSFFAISILGFFYMISKRGNEYTFSIASIGMVTLAIGFCSMIAEKIASQRFLFLSQIILVLLEALGLFILVNLINRRSVKPILLFIVITSLTFLTIISTTANTDNHEFSPNIGIRFAFTKSEMNAASFFSKNSVGYISSDFDYGKNPSSNLFTNYYNVPSSRLVSLDNSLYNGNFIHDKSIKIIRGEIINKPFRLEGGVYHLYFNPNTLLSSLGFNKIYDSSTVCGYI